MSDIVLDASAVLAVLELEPEATVFRELIVDATSLWIGAVGALECSVTLGRRRGAAARTALDTFLDEFAVRTLPFDADQLNVARMAYERFGKGRHPAGLNLGDCCAYAAARAVGFRLLQKGDDFPRTDLPLVDWRGA